MARRNLLAGENSLFDLKISQGILVVILAAGILAMGNEWLSMRDFMSAGARFSSTEGRMLADRISYLELQTKTYQDNHGERAELMIIEQRRLQQQIDRLETVVFKGVSTPPLPPYAGRSNGIKKEGNYHGS